ncbi:MAG: TetR/AcrR family transcriptional regulator [Treponema sp.]|jgi:AcrR family transcriptional regulator|nr:TetR/AcrR family transcriptional regulator [Treponema sp.]
MNKKDIIETAFRVWGQELFKTTGLSKIAQALGVTKPALYRHFESKDALLDGMYGYYCDHYVGFMKASSEKAVESRDINRGILLMARNIAEYYARYKYIFIFALIEVFGDKNREAGILEQFAVRGMDMKKHWAFLDAGDGYPSRIQMIATAIFFLVTLFHKNRAGKPVDPTEEEIQRFISFVEEIISHGLGFDKRLVDALDFAELEKTGAYQIPPEGENDRLLKAVAGAVAEAGPWNASMEMVARRSGLSKSGLYAHFKNKADMLGQMFITEFVRIVDYAELERSRSAVVEEQFYLVMVSIANYLRSRPEILITMDWLKTRRLELGVSAPPRIYRIFGDINLKEAVKFPEGSELTGEALAQWIMFLVVDTLMRRPEGISFSDVSNTSFRIVYKFIVLGIDGW